MAEEGKNESERKAEETKAEGAQSNGAAGPVVAALRKPIQANGEEVKELKFREPTGGDIERAGNPVNIDMFSGETIKVTFDERKMTAMMALLAQVPPSSIRQLHPKDWNSIAWQLMPFFTPDL